MTLESFVKGEITGSNLKKFLQSLLLLLVVLLVVAVCVGE